MIDPEQRITYDGLLQHADGYDVIVAGGGPGGSTAASWLARAGRRVIVFERDRFPRFHIGESLLACANDSLKAIGADDAVRAANYPEKWGASFMSADGRVDRYADFADAPGVPCPQTWQVPREHFDHLLLRHAAANGADVRERHRILDVAFDSDGVTVTVQPLDESSGRFTTRAHAFIDASGRGSLLSRKFNLRIDEPRLANIAVFSHYSGVPRRADRRRGDIRIVARPDLGWFWMIPISPELMSVGVVLPRRAFTRFQTMWFQDLWTYDFRRTEMCIIPYATQMGEISFCAYNTGVGWRHIVEKMHQNATVAEWYRVHGKHPVYANPKKPVPLEPMPQPVALTIPKNGRLVPVPLNKNPAREPHPIPAAASMQPET